MNTTLRTLIAGIFAVMLVASPVAAATSGPGLNFSDDRTPNFYVHEDTLTVAEHDRATMDSPLAVENDNGEVVTLPATVNSTQDTPVGVDFSNIDIDAYDLFPRVSGESENAHTWNNASNWSTSTSDATNVTPTLADADSDGVQKVQFSTSGMGAGDTATANFAEGVSIDTDADKRVLLFVGDVNSLATGATVEVRAVDSDGDYRYAEINTSRNANDSDVIANGTVDGTVFQEKLNSLPMAGTGDGTLGSIQSVKVVAAEADADVTVAGLDLDRKTTIDLGEIQRNTDGDSELETVTVEDYYEGGVADLTSLSSFGSEFDDAVINDLRVYNVRYEFADLTDSADYSTEFSDASNYGSYSKKLEVFGDINVPSYIDLSHGTLTLQDDQGLISERYATAELSEDVADDTAIGDLNDTDYTSKKSLYTDGNVDDTHTLLSSVSADTTYRVHMVVLLQDSEVDALDASAAMGGPTGQSGGFFSTVVGQITGLAAAVVSALGLNRIFGGN